MAALVSTTQPIRHILGDLAVRFFTFAAASVNTGDTLTIPGVGQILDVLITANAAAGAANDPAATWTGSVVTFLSGGAWGGTVAVVSRVG